MRSALEIVAFSNADELEGTIALLETALASLDRADRHLCGALVASALDLLLEEQLADRSRLAVSARH